MLELPSVSPESVRKKKPDWLRVNCLLGQIMPVFENLSTIINYTLFVRVEIVQTWVNAGEPARPLL